MSTSDNALFIPETTDESQSSSKIIREYREGYNIIPLDICKDEISEPYIKQDIVSVKDSLIYTLINENSLIKSYYNVADMVAFKGKSFKIGWTKQSTMLCLTKNKFHDIDLSSSSNDYEPHYRSIAFKKITNLHEDAFQNLENHLKCQLKYTVEYFIKGFRYSYTNYTFYKLHTHQGIVKDLPNDNYEKQIWNLLGILFNSTDEDFYNIPEDVYKFKVEKIRKRNLSTWIKSVVESIVEKEVNNTFNSDHFSKILSYISGNKINEAADIAMKINHPNLSLLISQLPSNTFVQDVMQTQLSVWENYDVHDYLDETIFKIFAIIAGTTMINVKKKTILAYERMDWIRIFALLFWYVSKKNDKLSDTVHMYEKMFEVYKIALKPTPDYEDAPESVYDLRFQLLKYYSDSSYPVTSLYNNFTHTNDSLDYRLSWFIFQTLHGLEQEDASPRARNHMHISFSAQLEQMGLWHWAIFILTFLTNNVLKRNMIEDMLGRHVMLQSEETPEYREREKMLIKKIKISHEWIDYMKAMKAIEIKNLRHAFHHFCFAREWKKANDILVDHFPNHSLLPLETSLPIIKDEHALENLYVYKNSWLRP